MPKKSARRLRRSSPSPVLDRKRAIEAAITKHYARVTEGLPPPMPSTGYLWGPHRRWLAEQYPQPRPTPHNPRPFDEWLRDNHPAVAERLERDREEHARVMTEWKERNSVSSHADSGDK